MDPAQKRKETIERRARERIRLFGVRDKILALLDTEDVTLTGWEEGWYLQSTRDDAVHIDESETRDAGRR